MYSTTRLSLLSACEKEGGGNKGQEKRDKACVKTKEERTNERKKGHGQGRRRKDAVPSTNIQESHDSKQHLQARTSNKRERSLEERRSYVLCRCCSVFLTPCFLPLMVLAFPLRRTASRPSSTSTTLPRESVSEERCTAEPPDTSRMPAETK